MHATSKIFSHQRARRWACVSASTVVVVVVFMCARYRDRRHVDANPGTGISRAIVNDRKINVQARCYRRRCRRFTFKQTPNQFRGPASNCALMTACAIAVSALSRMLVCVCVIERIHFEMRESQVLKTLSVRLDALI